MDVTINSLKHDEDIKPLEVGQIRVSKEKDEVILIVEHFPINKLGFVVLKSFGRLNKFAFISKSDELLVAVDFPIVAESANLMINIK
ncbi:hypothetical protein [Macrococcus capreoli]|uniref:hypothetical protein n=1 Tax=Macrococcus capreoli TaxID=2982690 RepID=UPI003EE7BED4